MGLARLLLAGNDSVSCICVEIGTPPNAEFRLVLPCVDLSQCSILTYRPTPITDCVYGFRDILSLHADNLILVTVVCNYSRSPLY